MKIKNKLELSSNLSPTLILALISTLLVIAWVLVDEQIEKITEDANGTIVQGVSAGDVAKSSLAGNKEIPLYGESRAKRALSNSIDESIFAVKKEIILVDKKEQEAAPKVVETVKKTPQRIRVNWHKLVRSQLTLNGVSTLNNSAYINGKRYKVGQKLVDLPIKSMVEERTPKLVRVQQDKVSLNVGGEIIVIRLKGRNTNDAFSR